MTTSTSGNFIRDISYSGLSKAYEINNQNNSKSNYFIYDANHNRAVRKDAQNNMRTKTTHYIGNVEMIKSASNGNVQSYKRYIGPMVIDMAIGSTPQSQWQYHYQLKDHLGSSHSIITLNTAGSQTESQLMSFDAWGQRRFVNNFTVSDINMGDTQFSGLIEKTTKGYTGHEHLDETGIIHMNGRIYTPYLGRFLQADPIIQDPFSTQSLNRYTYVGNNPLSANDPTGYWSVDAFMDNGGRQLIGVVISIVVPNPFIAGVLSGAVTGGTKGALIGAFSAVALGGIGDYFDNIGAASSTGKFLNTGLTAGQFAGKVALHGLVGGASSLGMGGKFGHGFASAGATQVSSPVIGKFGNQDAFSPKRVVLAAIVGGTVSSVTGGKFANGAVYGAWSRAFNDEHKKNKKEAAANDILDYASSRSNELYLESFTTVEEARMFASRMWGANGIITNREANWYVLRESLTSFRVTYPNVGAKGQVEVPLHLPYSVQTKIMNKNHISVSAVEIGHNHLSWDLKFSGRDAELFRNSQRSHFRKLKVWMWNSKGRAYTLNYSQANANRNLQSTYNGSRKSSFDL